MPLRHARWHCLETVVQALSKTFSASFEEASICDPLLFCGPCSDLKNSGLHSCETFLVKVCYFLVSLEMIVQDIFLPVAKGIGAAVVFSHSLRFVAAW